MSPEMQTAVSELIREARDRFGDDLRVEQMRAHFLDRWYRFYPTLETRGDLKKMQVTPAQHEQFRVRARDHRGDGAEIGQSWMTARVGRSLVTIDLRGTPLEGK